MNLDMPYSSQHVYTLQRACTQMCAPTPQTPAQRIHPHMHGAQKHPLQTGVLSTLHVQARTLNRRRDTSAHIRAHARQGEYGMNVDMLYSPQKMHMHPCMRAYATVQKLLCHGNYCELILSPVRASSRLPFAARPAAVSTKSVTRRCSRNPSKSTLAHDSVAAAVSHKHHSIIRVGAGLIQNELTHF